MGVSLSRSLRILVVLGVTAVGCTSGQEAASVDIDGFAFPVVEGIATDDLPIYRSSGFPRADGSVPSVDQIALLARADDVTLQAAVSVRAFVGVPRFVLSETVIDGRTVAISGDASSFADVQIATLTDWAEPGLLVEVRGVDPVAFLTNGGLQTISASLTVDSEPQLDLTDPPDGYSIVIDATSRYRASPEVTVELDGPDTRVQTTLNDPRLDLVPQTNFEKVTLGDRQVWRGQAGGLFLATWEEPAGIFTWAMSHESERTNAVVRATSMTNEDGWRDFYQVERSSSLVSELNGREFEAFFYEGYPFDPTIEERPLTIAFTDDTIIVRGVCASRNARVTSQANIVEATGPIQAVGPGCGDFEPVDQWQNDLISSTLTLSITDETLTVRATVNGDDIVIELAETTFTGYS